MEKVKRKVSNRVVQITIDNTYVGTTYSKNAIQDVCFITNLYGEIFTVKYKRKWLFFKKYFFIITGDFATTYDHYFKKFQQADDKLVKILIKDVGFSSY